MPLDRGRSGVQGPARLHPARASVLRPVRAAVLGELGVALPARAAARELPLAHPAQSSRCWAGDRLLPRACRTPGGQRGHDPRPEPQRPAPRRGAPGGAGRHGSRSRRAQAAARQGSVRLRRDEPRAPLPARPDGPQVGGDPERRKGARPRRPVLRIDRARRTRATIPGQRGGCSTCTTAAARSTTASTPRRASARSSRRPSNTSSSTSSGRSQSSSRWGPRGPHSEEATA